MTYDPRIDWHEFEEDGGRSDLPKDQPQIGPTIFLAVLSIVACVVGVFVIQRWGDALCELLRL